MTAIADPIPVAGLPAPTRPRPRWITTAGALAVLLLLYAGWQLFRWPGGDRTLIGDLFFLPMGAATVISALGAATRCRERPRLQAGWRLLAIAAGAYTAGDIAQTVFGAAGSKPYPSVADVLYLSFYPLMLWGLLQFRTGRRTLAQRIPLLLDLAVVAIGGSVVVMYVVLGPKLVQSGPEPLQTAISVAYPVGDMVLLVGLASLLLQHRSRSSRSALSFITAAVLCFVAADLVHGYITLHSSYQVGDPVDSMWMVAIALFAVAGAAQSVPARAEEPASEPDLRRGGQLPYISLAVAFGLLLFDLPHAPFMPDGMLIVSAVLLATLVSSRQYLAQRDLLQSQQRLSHQSLHDALTGLPNRVLLLDRAEQMLARARRTDSPCSVRRHRRLQARQRQLRTRRRGRAAASGGGAPAERASRD